VIEAGLIASRWLHYAATSSLFGLLLFALYSPQAAAFAAPGRLRTPLAIVALAALVAWFGFLAATLAGSIAEAPATAASLIGEPAIGPVWIGRALLAAALATPLARRGGVAVALAGALLASLALTGHARMHEGALGELHVTIDAAHLLAAGTWLGALAAFLKLLARAPDEAATVAALANFARVGTLAVATLALTGVANALLVLGDWRALFRTLYGFLLMTKVGLVVGMLAFAAANRFRLVPALARGPDRGVFRHLRGHVIGETMLGLVVLLIVAVIGTLDPQAPAP
jgi:putative copper resistance protein D